jgi:hypothetical protein
MRERITGQPRRRSTLDANRYADQGAPCCIAEQGLLTGIGITRMSAY